MPEQKWPKVEEVVKIIKEVNNEKKVIGISLLEIQKLILRK